MSAFLLWFVQVEAIYCCEMRTRGLTNSNVLNCTYLEIKMYYKATHACTDFSTLSRELVAINELTLFSLHNGRYSALNLI
jgi:hypothetical protein